jgi:protein ImuA
MDLLPSAATSPPLAAPPRAVARAAAVQAAPPAALRREHAPVRAPEALHPALWLGHQLGRQTEQALPSGFAALDAQLPGGGWPRRVLTELLQPHPGIGEMRLLSPCLAAVQQAGRLVMLFDPPAQLSAWALAQLGLDVAQLLVIQTRCKVIAGSDSLWALEQALKSGHVGAVLAWLPPRLRAERLRRLQLAAQAHDGPAFVLREMAAQQRPTAAPLRLALRPGGADRLNLRLLKRRGPPLETPLSLELLPVLSETARGRAKAAPLPDGVPAPAASPVLQSATFIDLASS